MFHREKTSSIYLLQVSGDENVGKTDFHFFFLNYGILCLKRVLTLKCKEIFFSFKISLSISLRESVGMGGLFWRNVSYVRAWLFKSKFAYLNQTVRLACQPFV